MIVVSDTSPVIALIRINQIQLLPALFQEVIIPVSVKQELNTARFNKAESALYKSCSWMVEKKVKGKISQNSDLDKGEIEAIALAKELHADFLLIDEKAGRKVAQKEGLRIIGVVGLLLLAKQRGLVNETLAPEWGAHSWGTVGQGICHKRKRLPATNCRWLQGQLRH